MAFRLATLKATLGVVVTDRLHSHLVPCVLQEAPALLDEHLSRLLLHGLFDLVIDLQLIARDNTDECTNYLAILKFSLCEREITQKPFNTMSALVWHSTPLTVVFDGASAAI